MKNEREDNLNAIRALLRELREAEERGATADELEKMFEPFDELAAKVGPLSYRELLSMAAEVTDNGFMLTNAGMMIPLEREPAA